MEPTPEWSVLLSLLLLLFLLQTTWSQRQNGLYSCLYYYYSFYCRLHGANARMVCTLVFIITTLFIANHMEPTPEWSVLLSLLLLLFLLQTTWSQRQNGL